MRYAGYGLIIKNKNNERRKSYGRRFEDSHVKQGNPFRYINQEKVITRLQVNGCLIAMVSDILDQLITDEQSMLRLLDVQYKQEQKMHYNQMQNAAKKYYFHLKPFTKSFFGDNNICADIEDNTNDIYEIIKLLADHTNDHKDMEVIKRNLRKRKLNHHIFD